MMRLILLCLLCFACLVAPAQGEGKRYALVVGVRRYGDPFEELASAEQDALTLEQAPQSVGYSVVTMTAESKLPARRPVSAKNIFD